MQSKRFWALTKKAAWLVVTGSAALSGLAAAEPNCTALEKAKLDGATQYVMKRYHVRASTDILLAETSVANGACFWKLRYELSDPKREIALYLSPDGGYLAPVLYDVNTDPSVEERKQRAETTRMLSEGDPPSTGPQEAPVTIVEFSDFECPFCRRAAEMLEKQILPEYGQQVRIIFRNYPLTIHPWAKTAAQLAVCAGLQKPAAFWQVHDFLFANQDTLKADNLASRVQEFVARETTLDGQQFEACVDKELSLGPVMKDMDLARRYGVHATPTIFVNGVRLEGVKDASQIRDLIANAGEKAAGNWRRSGGAAAEIRSPALTQGGMCKKEGNNVTAR